MHRTQRWPLLKKAMLGLIGLAVLWAIGCGLMYHEMRKPPEEFGRFMTRIPAPMAFLVFPFEKLWTRARAGTINVGEVAPDFELLTIDKSESIRLSELSRRQPVVLIFGSYT